MSEKYANKENLERFWDKAKEYIGNERQEIEDQLYNWQKTEKAPVVQCEPVPNSDLHPIVDFMFTETLPVSGDKGLDNPSVITGVSSITVFQNGKNLLPFKNWSMTKNGVTLTADSDGIITLNGTCTVANGSSSEMSYYGGKLHIDAGQKLTLSREYISGTATAPEGQIRVDGVQTSFLGNGVSNAYNAVYNDSAIQKTTFSFQEARYIGSQIIKAAGGVVYDNYKIRAQLELSDEKTDFEAIVSKPCLVNLNNTYYGGTLDVATGVMTVTWVGVVYDGTENIIKKADLQDGTPQYSLPVPGYAQNPTNQMSSTHFSFGYTANHGYVRSSGGYGFRVFPTGYDTLESFTAWVASQYAAGTPLTVAYKMASPITVQLTPQQIKSLASLEGTSKRINTLYTDADSIQVEYQKYVGVDSTLDNTSENAIQNKVVNSALNTKVSLTGNETIDGTKTFSSPINGSVTGDAGTVAGHIVSKDVPVNAAFTDTTYEPATQSTAGLMSASDKTKLDAVGSVFTFKGSVIDDTYLPASDNASGDAYLAEDTGHVHVYDGSSFVDIGVWAGIPSATDAQIDALFED